MLAALLVSSAGCGLQDSFRRPKRARREAEGVPFSGRFRGPRPRVPAAQAAYARAYASWLADHQSLVDRLSGGPKVVRTLYGRVRAHTDLMKRQMYEQEASAFQSEVIDTYEAVMASAVGAGGAAATRRRLEALGSRVQRSFRPGLFPLRRTGEQPAQEVED
ncbi:MAG: hypothetical protein HYU36_13415 [Planctomycetes bacterium]|nr:hypothetical protein [Planctomycetota bacterium]